MLKKFSEAVQDVIGDDLSATERPDPEGEEDEEDDAPSMQLYAGEGMTDLNLTVESSSLDV